MNATAPSPWPSDPCLRGPFGCGWPQVPPAQTLQGRLLPSGESESPDLPLRSHVPFAHPFGWKWPKGTLFYREGTNGLARLRSHFRHYMDILEQKQNRLLPSPASQSHRPSTGVRPLWGHPLGPHPGPGTLGLAAAPGVWSPSTEPSTPGNTSEITPGHQQGFPSNQSGAGGALAQPLGQSCYALNTTCPEL